MSVLFGLIAILFIVIAEVLIVSETYKKLQFPLLVLSLYGLFLHAQSTSAFVENEIIYSFLMTGMIAASVLGYWIKKRWHFLHLVFLFFVVLSPIFMLDKTIISNDFDFEYNWIFALIACLFLLLGYTFTSILVGLTTKNGSDQDSMLPTVYSSVILAVLVYASFFLYSNGGVLILTVYLIFGYLLSTKEKPLNIAPMLFILGSVPILLETVSDQTLDIAQGANLFALLMGFVAVILFELLAKRKGAVLLSIGLILLFSLCCILIYWLGTQKPDLGGVDALLTLLFGVGLGALFTRNSQGSYALIASVFCVSLTAGDIGEDESKRKQKQSPVKTTSSVQKEEREEVKTFPLTDLKGSYTIYEAAAEISFELGPKGGRTKGVITNVAGDIVLDVEQEQATVNALMQVQNLSTFNTYRDESLMEPGYFNVVTFPIMKYRTKTLKKEGENYILDGEFEMLGKSKGIRVTLAFLGEQRINGKQYPILSGSGKIDRTLFGMKPDSKEGNVVDFNLFIPLIKK
jgi:polyisoprenoid-binding protein YceI